MSRTITLGTSPVFRAPVDRIAARVLRPGVKYEPAKRVQTHDQATPFATITITKAIRNNPGFKDLTGRRVGRLTVYGLTDPSTVGGKYGKWACRCVCGTYTLRTAKALKNPANAEVDRCEHCRHLAYLQHQDHYRQTGRNKEG